MPQPDFALGAGTRWFLTGGGGQLATAFESLLEGEVFVAREASLDLRDAAAVRGRRARLPPRRRAAHRRLHRRRRRRGATRARPRAVNVLGTRHLVAAVHGTHAQVVSFSTDYVFDGRKGAPYVEHDEPAPAERLRAHQARSGARDARLAARHRDPHGVAVLDDRAELRQDDPGGGARARRRAPAGRPAEPLRVVDDQVGSPTYAGHLAACRRSKRCRAASGRGSTTWPAAAPASWCELAREVVALAGLAVAVEPITTAQAGRPAPRPAFSALASERRHSAAARLARRRGGRRRRTARARSEGRRAAARRGERRL